VSLEIGAILKQGESVWQPTTLKLSGAPSEQPFPMMNAAIVELFLVKKYFSPGTKDHLSTSEIS